VDFIKFRFVGNGFDPLLQGQYVVIASHDGDGFVFETLGKVHGADGDTPLRLFKPLRELKLGMTGGFNGGARTGKLVVGADEYTDGREPISEAPCEVRFAVRNRRDPGGSSSSGLNRLQEKSANSTALYDASEMSCPRRWYIGRHFAFSLLRAYQRIWS
jgi:hypothetical protein